MKLSVLVPVFNEATTVVSVIERLQMIPGVIEVIIINDASSDGTDIGVDRLASTDVHVLHHPINRGKGAAISTGLQAASGDVIVIQDADFEYDLADLPRLLEPIASGHAQVVYGVRSLDSQKPVMRLGNKLITVATNLLYGLRLQDMETCYKMMLRQIALDLDLECRRFHVEAEITAKLARAGFRFYQVPISYHARYENKKLSPLDGLAALRALWRYRCWQPDPSFQIASNPQT